jgi:hypothetical protein
MAGQVLAAAVVRGGVLITHSPNLSFDHSTGLVTFPNPNNLKATPVVSYISPNAAYATETVYFKEISNTTAIVWQGAQDTSGRNHPPLDFTIVVVGF